MIKPSWKFKGSAELNTALVAQKLAKQFFELCQKSRVVQFSVQQSVAGKLKKDRQLFRLKQDEPL